MYSCIFEEGVRKKGHVYRSLEALHNLSREALAAHEVIRTVSAVSGYSSEVFNHQCDRFVSA
eukprot:1423448-Alexandrium_andersonii.AAC.1